MKLAAACALALLAVTSAVAQPQPAPATPPIAALRDIAYPGVIRLQVDATDTDRRIFRVRETIPVATPGRLTLLYPQWLPGNHAPRGQIDKLVGLTFTAGGQPLAWTRDPVNVYAFHLDVPAGAAEVVADFQFVSPVAADQGRVVVTPEMLNLQWQAVTLYPAGHYASRIQVEPSVRLPAGWRYGVALDTAGVSTDNTASFRVTDLETLVDSPMFAGRHFQQVDLDPGAERPVRLNIVADSPDNLAATDEQIALHRNLVVQADRLFGRRPFDRYDFLLALTDRLGGIGLEHHRSSENAVDPDYFTDAAAHPGDRDLLPHEYVHTWNGKAVRPADLWTPNYDVAMRNSLLWVYEGQTTYWGEVLAARSGLLSREEAFETLARTAAGFQARVGRAWRPLQDTVNDPIVLSRRPSAWPSWRRAEDYYGEGALIWLDADTLIRERSGGRRSLDDFARRFFAGPDGERTVRTYTFDDVVAALNAVQPHDWAAFLRARLDGTGGSAPLDGIERSGWRLVFTDQPTNIWRRAEADARSVDLSFSLGLAIGREGAIIGVVWDGPAYQAGLAVGSTLVAVNGTAYDAEALRSTVRATRTGPQPIELLVRTGDRYRTVQVTYGGGLRYPRLERIEGRPDRLSQIYAPRSR